MSQDLKNNPSEEVDLIQLFGFFEEKIKSFFRIFYNLFKSIFGLALMALKEVFSNLKIILSILIVAVIVGGVLDKSKDKVYYAEMYVKPHFDSKYELVGNIDYYNSLIKLKDLDELSKRFDINKNQAKSLLKFEIEVGPESKNEQILKFNEFLKNIDSTTRSKIIFKDFIEDRNIFNASVYLIRARSTDYTVFKKIGKGLSKTVAHGFAGLKKKENNIILGLEEANLKASLLEIQKLKAVYIGVLEKESEKSNITSSLGSTLGIQVEKAQTKEDKLLEKEIEVLNKLNSIKKERILKNAIFDNYSVFKEKGLLENIWYRKFKIVLPILALLLLFLYSSFKKVYKYVLNS